MENIENKSSEKSRAIAALLSWCLGMFGVHRFYLGKMGTGVLMLLTLGGFGIWQLVDLFVILFGAMRDSEGRSVKDWFTSENKSSQKKTFIFIITAILSVLVVLFSLLITYGFYEGHQNKITACQNQCDFNLARKAWGYKVPTTMATFGQNITTKYFQTQDQCVNYCAKR